MPDEPQELINVLAVEPGRQEALVALLRQNIDAVVSTLPGWRSSRLIASADGGRVVIHSEWDTLAAIERMRDDPRMLDYFPKIRELATFESTAGRQVFVRSR